VRDVAQTRSREFLVSVKVMISAASQTGVAFKADKHKLTLTASGGQAEPRAPAVRNTESSAICCRTGGRIRMTCKIDSLFMSVGD